MAINGGTIVAILEMDTSKYGSAIQSAVAQTKIFGDDTATVSSKMAGLGKALTTVGTTMTLGVTMPIIGLGTAAVKSATTAESAFAGVRKTVDATEQEFASLRQSLVDMSQEIPTSFADLSKIMELAGQLGVDNGNLVKFTKTIADLGVSTNLTGEEAATMLAQYANVTGMDLGNIDRLGSVIVALGNNCATTEKDITEMAQRLSGVASVVNLTDSQVLGLAATMTELGINAEAGGSAMSKILQGMQQAVLGGGKDLKAFAKIAGTSGKDFAAAFSGDPIAALNLFVNGLSSIQASGGDVYKALDGVNLQDIRITDTLLRMAGAQGGLTDNILLANDAWEANNALTEEANKRYATTESQLQLAKNSVENMMSSLGDLLLPVVTEVTGKIGDLADWIGGLDDSSKNLILTIAGIVAAAGPLALVIGGLITIFTGPVGWVAAIVAAGAGIAALVGYVKNLNQQKIDKSLEDHFGSVALSAEQIADITSKKYILLFDSTELETAKTNANNATTAVTDLQKKINEQTYLIQTGVLPPAALVETVNSYVASGQTMIDSQADLLHIRVKAFFGTGSTEGEEWEKTFGQYFSDLELEAQQKGQELGDKAKELIADGKLDANDQKIIDNLRKEYEEIIRKATLEDTEVSAYLLKYSAQKEGLTAESVKALALKAAELKQAEIEAEMSDYEVLQRDTVRMMQQAKDEFGKPLYTDKDIAVKLDALAQQHDANLFAIAYKDALFGMDTYAKQVTDNYGQAITDVQGFIANATQTAVAQAKADADAYAKSAGLDLNTEEGQNAYRSAFDTSYNQALLAQQGNIGDVMPDATTIAGIKQMLDAMGPAIESVQTVVAGIQALGDTATPDQKATLANMQSWLADIATLQQIVGGPLAAIGSMSEQTATEADKALAAEQKAQNDAASKTQDDARKAAEIAASNQAGQQTGAGYAAQYEHNTSPESRAKEALAGLQEYAATLQKGMSDIEAKAMQQAESELQGAMDLSTPTGKSALTNRAQEIIEDYADDLSNIVSSEDQKKAQAAVEALMPDIQAARTQAAAMGDNVDPQLQALLDMYNQLETLAAGGSDLVQKLKDDVKDASNNTQGGADMAQTTVDGANTKIDTMGAVGSNVGGAYVAAIKGKIDDSYAAGKALAQASINGAAAAAQIASPSKVATGQGRNFGKGWVDGVEAYTDAATGAGTKIVTKTADAVNGGMGRVNDAMAAQTGTTGGTGSTSAPRPTSQSEWDKLVRQAKFNRDKYVSAASPALTAAEVAELDEAVARYERQKAARRRAQQAAELAAQKKHNAQLLKDDKHALEERKHQNEAYHDTMMALIGDQAMWYADTPLENALKASDDHYKAEEAKVDKEYKAWLKAHKHATKAQKEEAQRSHDERIAQIEQYAQDEQEQLQEDYQTQQDIALKWIDQQRELAHKALDERRNQNQEDDYQEQLADLKKQQRQSKSAREKRELQEQIDDMERDHALDQEEAALAKQDDAWAKMEEAVQAGLIGLGDLLPGSGLPTVANGSAGLEAAMAGIDAESLQAILSSLQASTSTATNANGTQSIQVDLRGATVRSDDDISDIIDKFEAYMRSRDR